MSLMHLGMLFTVRCPTVGRPLQGFPYNRIHLSSSSFAYPYLSTPSAHGNDFKSVHALVYPFSKSLAVLLLAFVTARLASARRSRPLLLHHLSENFSTGLFLKDSSSTEDISCVLKPAIAYSSEPVNVAVLTHFSELLGSSSDKEQFRRIVSQHTSSTMSSSEGELGIWLDDVKDEAKRRGVSEETIIRVLDGLSPSEKILEKDQNQPEKKLTAESYIRTMVTEFRISQGVKAYLENIKILEEVSKHYGVPAPVLASIWGIESNYGTFPGSWNVIQALLTLAYQSPLEARAAYFKEELFHALLIEDKGDEKDLKGSWAGAMGQCQFMPSSYVSYAVDYDKDGRRDIWKSHADVFASMANYLVCHGWKSDGQLAQKVRIMTGNLEEGKCGMGVRKTIEEWKNEFGLIGYDGSEVNIDSNEMVSLVIRDMDMGVGVGVGVGYVVSDNFRTLMRYNCSSLYCMAVYELAAEIDSRVTAAITIQIE